MGEGGAEGEGKEGEGGRGSPVLRMRNVRVCSSLCFSLPVLVVVHVSEGRVV